MELTELTKPFQNKVRPLPFDQFQKNGDWMVPRGRSYYTPMGNFVKGIPRVRRIQAAQHKDLCFSTKRTFFCH